MGKAIFQTEIIELGEQVDAFFEEGMFVLFGENVPDTLKDFCHFIDQKTSSVRSLPCHAQLHHDNILTYNAHSRNTP